MTLLSRGQCHTKTAALCNKNLILNLVASVPTVRKKMLRTKTGSE